MKLQPINTLESGINVGATFTNFKKNNKKRKMKNEK